MDEQQQYVWYASYGSNINRERFLCYIEGGSPEGSTRVERGCRDQTPPVSEDTFIINYPLYFAKEAAGWQNQGVAFIGLDFDHISHTYSKKYLITKQQFFDVVKQENSGRYSEINLDEVIAKGSKTFCHAWYGNILYLGEDQGYPIFTFTAPWNIRDAEWNQPAYPYLATIIKGLKKDYSDQEVYDYFKSKPGIEGQYSEEELKGLIYSS